MHELNIYGLVVFYATGTRYDGLWMCQCVRRFVRHLQSTRSDVRLTLLKSFKLRSKHDKNRRNVYCFEQF